MIPKKIHYCWFGGKPLPEIAVHCIESWKKFCPDYEIIEWNETNFDVTQCKYMKQAYDHKKWGFVPDYARFKIIYDNGGFYLDTDVEVVKSFDSLLKCPGVMGYESETMVNGGNIIASEKGNPVIESLFKCYETISFVKPDGSLNLLPSPHFNTKVLKEYGLRGDNTLQYLDNITVFPTEYFCPKDMKTGIVTVTDNTYSIHHYDGSWVDPWRRKVTEFQYKVIKKLGNNIFSKFIYLSYHIISAFKNLGFIKGVKYCLGER